MNTFIKVYGLQINWSLHYYSVHYTIENVKIIIIHMDQKCQIAFQKILGERIECSYFPHCP